MITLDFQFRLISKDNEKIYNRQGRFFLSKKFKDFEKEVRDHASPQYRGQPLTTNVGIAIHAFYTNKVHPDASNLFKSLNDALQGITYLNDRQIKKAVIEIKSEKAPEDSFQVFVDTL